MFEPLEEQSIDEREKAVLAFWQTRDIFQKSLSAGEESSNAKGEFTFYDGPPFATGRPHYGHLLAGVIKDVIPRYKSMQGFHVARRFGWDCHGLPVETEAEKQCDLSGSGSIEAFGIGRFNEICRAIVSQHDGLWTEITARIGRWVDMTCAWHTMDLSYMESVWWVFKQLFDRGLVYQDFKVLPFSWKLGTPLSNFEASQNYQEVDDPSLIVKFNLKSEHRTSLLAWTTTPWTLLANMALAVKGDIEYVKLQEENSQEIYILSKVAAERLFAKRPHRVLASLTAKDLEGYAYEPLFPYFGKLSDRGAFRVISDPFVTLEEGTGIVHTAPAFGESDFYACRKHGIPLVCHVDDNGYFSEEVGPFKGLHFLEANARIIRALLQRNMLFANQRLRHRYPMCWRTDTRLMYRATKTWFVSVETLKDALIANNAKIKWIPEHIQAGRFGKWLEGARDWAISRNRYWGTPIPLWQCEEGDTVVVESAGHLEALTGQNCSDLHRHHIDSLTFEKEGRIYRRIPQVFDCWFESGAMPFAHRHYPFEGKSAFEKGFPADFIAEGLDQTRGWFYTLSVLATALFDKPAFRNAIVNGIVLAGDGAKMSKRLNNYPDPKLILQRFGADALRLYMLQSPAVRGESLLFSEAGVEGLLRKVLLPWWNAYSFLATYARIYSWQPSETGDLPQIPEHVLDRWILSRLGTLIEHATNALDEFALFKAGPLLVDFVEELTNWYIRRSRRRFWEDEKSPDRDQAFQTLYQVLLTFCQLAAPLVPFISENIYQRLRSPQAPESVHLSRYPLVDQRFIDLELERDMDLLSQIASCGHSLRKESKLRVRQPLASLSIYCRRHESLPFLARHGDVLEDELNVKEVRFLAEESSWSRWSVKPKFPVLGKKWGPLLPFVQRAIHQLDQSALRRLASGESIRLIAGERAIELLPEEVDLTRQIEGPAAHSTEDFTLILDTDLTPELIAMGIVRELINKINTLRRDEKLAVEDRIDLQIRGSPRLEEIFEANREFICAETLVSSYRYQAPTSDRAVSWSIDALDCEMAIKRAGVE